ncbi:MAG: hypothetical protein K0Q59_393 [Paenibacillus sp.]|nr:hypothetical protein [Paenibacillus sp.]
MDDTVGIVKQLFEQIRVTKQIPLAQIRTQVIPMVRKSVEHMHLFQLFTMLRVKQDYVYRHSIAVSVLSMLLGKWMGLKEAELLQLTTAAIMHDFGKTQIPVELLSKPGPLSKDEFEVVKRHTVLGYEMVQKTVGTTQRQALVALQHHERVDGSGYPHGLKFDEIDVFSRIVAVADVFHAMCSTTVYRTQSPLYEVLQQLENNAYGTFDPAVTRVLLQKFMQALIGYEVLLTDGSVAKIVLLNPQILTRPLIQVGGQFIDMSKEYSLHIEQVYYPEDIS